MTQNFTIRWLTPETAEIDAAPLLRLIRHLAEFEAWEEFVDVDEAELIRRACLPNPPFRAVVAEVGDISGPPDGQPAALVGMATLFTTNYTYAQRPSLELEMLYVESNWRSQGVGAAIMDEVLRYARGEGYVELEWNVLKTNARAQKFYTQLGGKHQDHWHRWGLEF